jgi:hypothetical protein
MQLIEDSINFDRFFISKKKTVHSENSMITLPMIKCEAQAWQNANLIENAHIVTNSVLERITSWYGIEPLNNLLTMLKKSFGVDVLTAEKVFEHIKVWLNMNKHKLL